MKTTENMLETVHDIFYNSQWELFLSEVNNMETIVAIEANTATNCLQNEWKSSRCITSNSKTGVAVWTQVFSNLSMKLWKWEAFV